MTAYLSGLGGPLGTRWTIRGMTPFVHAAGHTPVRPAWSYGSRPAHVAARSWLPPGDRNLAIDPDAALDRTGCSPPRMRTRRWRFLPMWDSVLLAHEDRARMIPPAYRAAVIRSNGDVLPTFLVDGLVAGVWRAELVGGRTEIIYSPFGQLPRDVPAELDAEAETLARFVEPHEPEVCGRYRRWWVDIARVTDLAPT